jgi:pimeloyl-ACP methyl ester carboxylesterase
MAEPIEQFALELPHGITLSCRAAGERGQPTLVFLHGFPEAAFVWDATLQHFARPENGGYRCIAPNLRGFERSSSPTDPKAYRAKFLVQDIAALIRAEAGGQPLAALVAHDWGGALAWGLANQLPALTQRLVIINSPHPGTFLRELKTSPEQQAASAYMNFLIRPDAEQLLAAADYRRLWDFFLNMGAGPDRGEPNRPPGGGWLTDDVKAQYRAVWGLGLTGGCNYYRASPLRPPRPEDPGAAAIDLPRDMLTVDLPTLVLWAMNDIALPPALTEGLQDYVPRLDLQRIEGATHWVVHEQPREIARRIQAFLARPA